MTERTAQVAPNDGFDFAAQWADDPAPQYLQLPSGRWLRVQTPDLPSLAKAGLIPNHMLPIIERFILNERDELKKVSGASEVKPGERLVALADFYEYADAFTVASAVEPKLSFDGREGTVAVTRLDRNDRLHVYNWGAGLVTAVATFPGNGAGPDSSVSPASDGAELRDTPE